MTYRWNTSAAAEAFDQAAEFIHPFYLAVQDQVIAQLAFDRDASFSFVDLGGGSGRLVERILKLFPNSRAVLVDQSEPFLALAERRLQPFGPPAVIVKARLQDAWQHRLAERPAAIVSMSAIHHLDPAEKRVLFARCHAALAAGGVFVNGDECRPETDAEYLAALQWWAEQKQSASARGLIPTSFQPVWEAWYDRNIRRFGQPRQSGDDCHETLAAQADCLRDIGFHPVEAIWSERLWAIIAARKAGRSSCSPAEPSAGNCGSLHAQ